jgi:hypothetical protein
MSNLALSSAPTSSGRQWDRAMFYAVFAAGIAAGIRYAPIFWFITPLVAVWLWKARRREFAAPVTVAAGPSAAPLGQFPPRVNAVVESAIAQLPPGDGRKLLGGVIRQARPLFGMTSSNFDPSKDDESRSHASDLVIASCDTALELARLDMLIASGPRAPGVSEPLDKRYAVARAEFAKRLTDAAAALGELYASGIEHGTPASDRVAELAAELTADAASRAAAKVEMDELLK